MVEADRVGFLGAGGKMAHLIAAHDWAQTPLGPLADWPVSIITTVGLILRSPLPIVTLWGDVGTLIYNDAYSDLAGARHPALLGLPVRDGWPEVADFNDNVMRVGLGGGTLSYRDQELILYRSGDAEQVFMNLDYSPVIGEGGTPIGLIGIVGETTKQIAFNREQREREARLRFLDELGRGTAASTEPEQVMAITTRMLGEYLGVSICAYADMDADQDHFTIRGDWSVPGSPSIVGYYSLADFGALAVQNLRAGRPLIIGDNLKEIAPEEAATFQAIGITATICMPLVKEGRLTALMAVHDKAARHWTDRDLKVLREVTERSWAHVERVRSQADVRASGAQFRTFAQAMPNHVWTAPADGMLDWFNDQVYVYSGAKSGELDGEQWASIVHPDDIALAGTAWAGALRSGSNYQVEFRLRRQDGQYRWHLARAVPLRDEAGQIVRWIGTNTDVDDQKNAEVLLERRLAERTATLAETDGRLQQAQKMEAIGNLTGGIAHDFNNLLSAVMGSLELLKKRLPDDPALTRLVNNAMEGAQRGAALTGRMLAFARRQDLKSERVDPVSLVAGMTELLQRALGPMITVQTDFATRLSAIDTDPNQLESALLNLAVNARDAMHGEGRIVIAGREVDASEESGLEPGHYVCLSVTDTGDGMDEATLKRAVEPFFTTKGVGKGTGLGLSMVHGLAAQSGGALKLVSHVGEGTSAEIWLPVAGDVVSRPLSIAEPPRRAAPSQRKLRILAVDDDALVLMNTAEMLEDLGHEVVTAYSGSEALAMLEDAGRFDLLITDHAMPQMTGTQLALAVGRRRPELPIVLATGYAELPQGTDLGLPRLPKPFLQADLAKMLAAIIA